LMKFWTTEKIMTPTNAETAALIRLFAPIFFFLNGKSPLITCRNPYHMYKLKHKIRILSRNWDSRIRCILPHMATMLALELVCTKHKNNSGAPATLWAKNLYHFLPPFSLILTYTFMHCQTVYSLTFPFPDGYG
jgi:hypothetical protein